MTLFSIIVAFASFFAGLIFPTYHSILALESADGADDSQWLTYWLCYSVLTISEKTLISALKWVPLYTELRLVLLIWLVAPQTRGAQWLYEEVLLPGLTHLRREAAKFPALERYLKAYAPGPEGASQTAAPSVSEQRSRLKFTLQAVGSKLEHNLDTIASIPNPAAQKKASKAFERDLRRLSGIGSNASTAETNEAPKVK